MLNRDDALTICERERASLRTTDSAGESRTSSELGLNAAPSTATRTPERSGPAGP